MYNNHNQNNSNNNNHYNNSNNNHYGSNNNYNNRDNNNSYGGGYNGRGRDNRDHGNSREGGGGGQTSIYGQSLDNQLASQEKKTAHRRTVDHGNNMGRWYINRSIGLEDQPIGKIRPESSYLIDLLPSPAYANNSKRNMGIMDTQSKFVHLSSNKAKHSINTVKWTPEGEDFLLHRTQVNSRCGMG